MTLVIKAVIFDWDGTLADTKSVVVKSFQKVFAESGCRVSDEFIARRMGIGTKKTIIEAFRRCNIRLDISALEKLSQKKIKTQSELSDVVTLFDGATELLDEVQRKFKIGLATMSSRRVIERMLKEKKIGSYFEVVVSADDVV